MIKVILISLQKYGGGPIDTLGFSNGLVNNGFFHQIIISDQNELKEEFLKENIKRKVYLIKTFQSNYFSFLINTFLFLRWFSLIKILFKEKPKVVHVIQFHPWVIFIFLIKFFLNFKILYAVHDNPFEPKEDNPLFMNFMEKFFIKRADLVLTYSEFIKRSIIKYIHNKKIEILYLGIHKDLCPNFNKAFDTSKKDLNVLFFGRLEAYKGIDVLIKAFEILKKEKLDINLVIAGRGELEENLKNKISELKIEFKNYWISRNELCKLLQWADVLVAPYKQGTQSGIVNTSLAYGIPIIVTDVGSFSEFIKDGETGFLIPPNDPETLAEKIKFFYENRDKIIEMSKKILEFNQNFSWDKIASRAIKLYHEYINN